MIIQSCFQCRSHQDDDILQFRPHLRPQYNIPAVPPLYEIVDLIFEFYLIWIEIMRCVKSLLGEIGLYHIEWINSTHGRFWIFNLFLQEFKNFAIIFRLQKGSLNIQRITYLSHCVSKLYCWAFLCFNLLLSFSLLMVVICSSLFWVREKQTIKREHTHVLFW